MADTAGLEFLSNCTDEQLKTLADILNKGKHLASNITYNGNHAQFVARIQQEVIEFGSNTLWFNKSYKEILMAVCDKVDAPYNSSQSIEKIEMALIVKTFGDNYDKSSDNEKKAVLEAFDENVSMRDTKGSALALTLFKTGGFGPYKMAVIIANNVSKFVLGRGLPFAANATLTWGLKRAFNIALPITVIWGIWDIAGPAYRVTVPAVTYIACLRLMYQYN